jgi:acyl dehydratase
MPISEGDTATRTQTITDETVRGYADIVDDHNPVHLDDDYAATTPFGKRIAHGMLVASVISAALANDMPGPGTIYLGQQLNFKKPVFLGETVTATLTCTKYRESRRIATIETIVTNQDGVVVIQGEATVMLPAD